ncbi:MAG: hypothetical protein KDA61_10895 [Planctomycetales bacterium]|nr:hypothetical protein [Planctomycetales bacterium]
MSRRPATVRSRLPQRATLLAGAAFVFGFATASSLTAQRVQFPTNTAGGYGAPPTYGAPAYNYPAPSAQIPSFDPYSAGGMTAPPLDVPYSQAPAYTAPLPTTPTYPGSPYGAPPYSAPYGYGAPAPNSGTLFPEAASSGAYPPQPGNMFPNGAPVGWESGSYQWQNSDGTVARLQRFLQQISFEHTYLFGEARDQELEINRSELSATFGIPVFYNADTPLLVTPGFAFNWLKGPLSDGTADSADLPPQLYDAYLDAAWHPKLADWLHADLGFRTGVWSDFKEVNSDSVRFLGRGLGVLAFSPRLDLLVGVWYLDRNDIKLLPAGGVHWRPNSEWDAYIVFPNPKIRKRFVNIGSSQWWWYVAGEYGGGRWTIERADGRPDDIDINDIRVILGFEWETQTQARGHVEVGYVWDREILFDQTLSPARYTLDDTVMIRAGIDF